MLKDSEIDIIMMTQERLVTKVPAKANKLHPAISVVAVSIFFA